MPRVLWKQNHRKANAQRRVDAICRQSEHCRVRHRSIVHLKAVTEEEERIPPYPATKADATAQRIPDGVHAMNERRGRAQPHQTPQHSIAQLISEKLRERIQPYAATLVYSGVCTQLA